MSAPDRLTAALAGRYRLERELGAGGMATVYLAHDLRHDRQVALKVLRPELAATLGPERFLNEIHTAARLTHPHILPVHDSGEAAGFLFYVMPFIDGETLRERLSRQGVLPVAEAARLLRDVADALAAAHALGVVDRDIKPDNILLTGRHHRRTEAGPVTGPLRAPCDDGVVRATLADTAGGPERTRPRVGGAPAAAPRG